MTFSKSTKIAIKAISFLGTHITEAKHYSLLDIAHTIKESEHTLGKTLQLLVKDKLIHSVKGPNGGFYMDSKQLESTLLQISEAIEGKFVFNKCVLGFDKCSSVNPCLLHSEFKLARMKFEKVLLKTSIKKILMANSSLHNTIKKP